MHSETHTPHRLGATVIGILSVLAVILVSLIVWESVPKRESPGPAISVPVAEIPGRALSAAPELKARSLEPSDGDTIRVLNDDGLAFYTQGDFLSAADRFQQALDQKPSDPVLIQNLSYAKGSQAWKRVEEGRLEEARSLFEEAVDLNGTEPAFFTGLGLIEHRLQNDEAALTLLKKAVSIRSDSAQPYLILADIYYERDELDLAAGYLETALDLQPGDAAVRERLAKVRREQQTQGSFRQQASLHFTVSFEGPEQYDTAQEISALLEEAYMNIGRQFFFFPDSPVPVLLYSNRQFRDVTLTPSWSKGLFDGKIRIPIEGIRPDSQILKKVVYHEYVHALVHAICPAPVPTWLNEGLALSFEGGGSDWNRTLRELLRSGRNLISLRDLDGSFLSFSEQQASMAYAESYSATQYLIRLHGYYEIKDLLSDLAAGGDFDAAFENRFSSTVREFEMSWRSGLTL